MLGSPQWACLEITFWLGDIESGIARELPEVLSSKIQTINQCQIWIAYNGKFLLSFWIKRSHRLTGDLQTSWPWWHFPQWWSLVTFWGWWDEINLCLSHGRFFLRWAGIFAPLWVYDLLSEGLEIAKECWWTWAGCSMEALAASEGHWWCGSTYDSVELALVPVTHSLH